MISLDSGYYRVSSSFMTTTPVLMDPAIVHFADKLSFETDPSDVHADFVNGTSFVLIDSRGDASWRQGRITGALHIPTGSIATQALASIPISTQSLCIAGTPDVTARPGQLSPSPPSATKSKR
ncbi:hypothetical protein [Cryobacterium sp. Y11]|uniref:hypothetical protein n=1 Tax=Cryobacterium sp. Y11 TaxID=2045016 RepID=UPI00351889E1